MPHYKSPYRSLASQDFTPPPTPYYPGVNPYSGSSVTDTAESSALVPVTPQAELVDSAATPAAKSGFSLPNLGELKGIIDRMGGIDGIMNTVGKVQKVMAGVQQFAPMAKLLMGSLLPGAKGGASSQSANSLDEYRPKKRRSSSKRRSKRSSSSKKATTKKGNKGRRR